MELPANNSAMYFQRTRTLSRLDTSRSGILSGAYDICEWATRIWVAENCPNWEEGQPLILDQMEMFTQKIWFEENKTNSRKLT